MCQADRNTGGKEIKWNSMDLGTHTLYGIYIDVRTVCTDLCALELSSFDLACRWWAEANCHLLIQ